MPIQALPATSIRALGSGQVLTDSLALVKELLDNSLDASATQISIEVSQNALNTIQVRDNGHGIPEEDRDAMALRYCTSKIQDFGDIQDCRSLGFRGEALASAAELAGALAITTRVEGEKIAVSCTCDRAGRVVGRKPVSAPVGTTVRITDFFRHLPVRRENAIKGASKVLARLRTLMQKYYLSHPHCRFSLRILASPQKGGAKGRNEDIVYAPSKSIQEAVQKAVGKDVAATCEWIDTSSAAYAEALAGDNAEDAGEKNEEYAIVLEALLPKPGTDPAVISKKPQCTHFIFVDSRSVSCARGTLKQIHTLYKSYLKSVSATGLSDPFVYLNICCPPGAYDPNIEPAKDDVLFHDEEAIVKSVERMLKRFYGELKLEERGGKGKALEAVKLDGFELLLARKPKASVSSPAAREHWPKPKPTPSVRPLEDTNYDGLDEDEEEMAAIAMDTVMESSGFVAVNSPVSVRQVREETEPQRSNGKDEDQSILPIEDDLVTARDIEGFKEIDRVPILPEPEPETAAPSTSKNALPTNLTTPKRKPTNWGFNMSGGLDEDDDEPMDEGLEQHSSDNEETVRQDITLSNPWTTAKMNAPIISSPIVSSPSLPSPTPRPLRKPFKPPTRTTDRSSVSPARTRNEFPTPAPSSPSARIFRENRGSVIPRMRLKKKNASAGLMNSWISRTPRDEDGDDEGGEEGSAQSKSKSKSKGFVSAAKVYKERINDAQDDEYDDDHHQQRQKQPVRVREITRRTKTGGEASKRRRLDNEQQENSFTPINIDDYDLGPAPARHSPHKNRFLAAAAALSAPASEPEQLPPPTHPLRGNPPLPPPNQKRSKRRRTKMVLPLDSVPEPLLQTHHISKTVDLVSGNKLKDMFESLQGSDGYVGGAAASMVTGREVGEMFFSESAEWGDLEVVGSVLKQWLVGVAERVEGLGDLVEGLGWECREEEGERRVMWAVRIGEEDEEGVMQLG